MTAGKTDTLKQQSQAAASDSLMRTGKKGEVELTEKGLHELSAGARRREEKVVEANGWTKVHKEETTMSAEKKDTSGQQSPRQAPDSQTKANERSKPELSEQELARASGGSVGKGEQKKW